MLDQTNLTSLEAYSRCEMSAIELRKRFGGITYGDVLLLLSEHNLPLPNLFI